MSQKVSEEKIKWIKELRESGNNYDTICKITKSSKRTVRKICDTFVKEFTCHPIKIPEGMKETQFAGYYITENGRAYRRPGKMDRNGKYGRPDENGLIYLKPSFRGHPKYPQHQYECVNISIWDENGKYLKQIKKSIHQLVAQAFIPNPNNYTEIDHIDRNKKNNSKNNLRWTTRFENMSSWERNDEYRKKLSENNRWKSNV